MTRRKADLETGVCYDQQEAEPRIQGWPSDTVRLEPRGVAFQAHL